MPARLGGHEFAPALLSSRKGHLCGTKVSNF